MSGPPSSDVVQKRQWRKRILEILATYYDSAPGVAIQWEELSAAVRSGRIMPSEVQAARALGDLIDRQLVAVVPHSFRHNVQCYRLTYQGRDFVEAGFPWEELDPYTGDQRFGGGG